MDADTFLICSTTCSSCAWSESGAGAARTVPSQHSRHSSLTAEMMDMVAGDAGHWRRWRRCRCGGGQGVRWTGQCWGQLQVLGSGSGNTGGDFISSTADLLHDTLYCTLHGVMHTQSQANPSKQQPIDFFNATISKENICLENQSRLQNFMKDHIKCLENII